MSVAQDPNDLHHVDGRRSNDLQHVGSRSVVVERAHVPLILHRTAPLVQVVNDVEDHGDSQYHYEDEHCDANLPPCKQHH